MNHEKSWQFSIHSIIRGGKNHVGITRWGRRYPLKSWVVWRDRVVSDLKEILKPSPERMITKPCRMTVAYVPGDLKRRDLSAMLDSLFHCFEKAGLIEDDALVTDLSWTVHSLDRNNPKVEVRLEEK